MLARLASNQALILLIVLFSGSFAVWFMFLRSLKARDPREPISIHPRIPVVGHAISLFLYGSNYYEKIRYITYPHEHSLCSVLTKGFKGEDFTPNLHTRAFRAQNLPCKQCEACV